ncbi:MAG TPA: SDR family oxidoreductase [Acidimicrobiales bacterium]|nr:SDR family oxidoreductase [Acidimicrobiales bacterium]
MQVTRGTTVLVTGASSGIGAALAPMLAARGARVGVLARRAERLAEVLARCDGDGHRAWTCDLGDIEAAERVALDAWDEFGHLDVIVHNAAIPKRRTVQQLTPGELDDVMAVNFFAPARMTLAVLPRMLARDSGVIVNVSSLGGRLGIVHESAYCASKFALCGWSESMAVDLWDTGIDVRLIIPGPIATEIWDLPDNDDPLYHGPFEPPESVAADIITAIEGDRFETYSPDMKDIAAFKTTDIDLFLEGVVAMARQEQEKKV